MKIIGIIPARYQSTRFPGKPLADLCGKPMIWWVYKQAKKVKEMEDVVVATDDIRIKECCELYNIPVVMTKTSHPNHIERLAEVADRIDADFYVCINGDEPLVEPQNIRAILPQNIIDDKEYACYLMRELKDPVETVDPANIKVNVLDNGKCIYLSRAPIPYPKGTLDFKYKKLVGIECYNKSALDFFVSTPMGKYERIEDIDHLRFIENGKDVNFIQILSDSLSVDTKNDLERVRTILEKRLRERKDDE